MCRTLSRLRRHLPATTLVHEAYLRLFGTDSIAWACLRHFFAATRAMRCVLVDQDRRAGRQKRGGGRMPLSLNEGLPGERPVPAASGSRPGPADAKDRETGTIGHGLPAALNECQ